jgi:hypothetical protein
MGEVNSPSNDRVMHDRFVRLILKVRIPTTLEMWCRPVLHLSQLLLCRPDLDTRINAISGEWSGTLKVPFVEDSFLDFRDTADEIIETLRIYILLIRYYFLRLEREGGRKHTRFSTENREREVMILEIETNTRQVHNSLNASLLQLLRVTDTRSLEDQWR